MSENFQIEDFDPFYQTLSKIIGFENAVKLGKEFQGEDIYFPKLKGGTFKENRNRKIIQEFKGHNARQLARKYDLTIQRIRDIVKGK